MTTRRSRPAAAHAAVFLLFVLVSLPCAAQDPTRPATVPGVQVVATRIPEPPKDVPASIEVITGDNLRARGATSLRDALSLAAGVAIAPGGDAGPASAVAEMWGLREFDAFLLVVDGIPWGGAFNPAVSTMSLRDVDHIEVLRGSAPVTYGATSFVGVISVVHKASSTTTRWAELTGGTFGTGSGAIEIAGPTTAAWNTRLSADFERQGFKDDNTAWSRGHGLFRAGRVMNDRTLWFSADLNVLRQDPASPHPRQGAALSTSVPLDANHNPSGAYINENRVNFAAGAELPVFNGARWGSMASYTFSGQSMFRGFLVDVANTPNNASGFKETIDISDLYVDTHVIWPTKSQVRFLTGADLLFANGEGKGATFTYTAPLTGGTRASVAEPSTLNLDSEDRRTFVGAYASAEWRPNGALTLDAGLRLNATVEQHGEENEAVTHTRPAGSLGALFNVWQLNQDYFRLFANYRNTFKPAAFDFSLAENEEVLDPETSNSFEAGIKTQFMQGRVDVEASAFRMDFENLVTSTVVNNLPALVNAGTTRFKGFEVAADVRLPQSLTARATYSFHDGKFVDYVQAFDGVPTQLGGKRFEMSARQLASIGLTCAPERGFVAHASMNYTGDRYLNKRNTALVPSFTTFDAGIGYRTDRAEFRMDGRNLGDRRDAVSESEFGDAQYYRMTAMMVRAGVAWRY